MAAHWVVFAAFACVLGGGCAAPCEPCDVVEPIVPVFPAPPAAPCLSQNIEATPGTVVPYVVDAIEEVISPCAPPVLVANPLIFPGVVTPPMDTDPCAPPAFNPAPCNAEGKPVALPTPLSFPIPTPPSLPASSIFSILSQAQNGGDPSAVLSQVSKFLASTLPCPHLQAAAAATPPPQALGAAPANKAPPIVSTPTIQIPVSYLPPPPSILSPTPKVDPVPVEPAVAGYGQALNPATFAAMQPYANGGLRSPPPEFPSQFNLAASLPPAEAPSAVEVAAPAFEFPKFGQATRQLMTPWSRVYEPLRRMYTPHHY